MESDKRRGEADDGETADKDAAPEEYFSEASKICHDILKEVLCVTGRTCRRYGFGMRCALRRINACALRRVCRSASLRRRQK